MVQSSCSQKLTALAYASRLISWILQWFRIPNFSKSLGRKDVYKNVFLKGSIIHSFERIDFLQSNQFHTNSDHNKNWISTSFSSWSVIYLLFPFFCLDESLRCVSCLDSSGNTCGGPGLQTSVVLCNPDEVCGVLEGSFGIGAGTVTGMYHVIMKL